MERTLTLAAFTFFASALSAQDQCATALTITAGTHVVSAVNGTEIPAPLCVGNGDGVDFGEWYSYTPSADLGLKITSDLPINSGGDTRFHIYTGSCGALICVGGDDDDGDIGNGYLSVDSLNVTAGVTYTIVWDDRWSTAGFTFQLIEGPQFELPFGFYSIPNPTEGRVLAAVDMNDDGLDDIVTVDSTRVIIHYQLVGGGFEVTTYTTTEVANEPTWSLCAGDLDGNGYNDLIYGGGQGVTFMMANSTGTGFTEVSYPQYVFSQRSNMVDINNDGHLDAFVCHDVQPNVFYMNDGQGVLTFNQGGLGDVPNGGNYGSLWTDYDNDGDLDLFIAKCRGGENVAAIDELHRNNGNGTFTEVAEEMNLSNGFHQSWSGAWGDFDHDGDMDVLVGASSLSFGGHKLFRNDGTIFTEVTAGSGLEAFIGLSNEWTTHDFDNDGWLDIMGGGAIHLGTGPMTFTYGVAASNQAVGDLNNDGFLDYLSTSTVRYNNTNNNNWLKVLPVGTLSNRNAIGARIEVTTALGTQIREIRSGDGFRYMSSLMAHFGLGTDAVIESVIIRWPSGEVSELTDVDINSTLVVEEELTTGISVADGTVLGLFPNPATDVLYLSGAKARVAVSVVDISGKRVYEGTMENGQLDVRALPAGLYTLQVSENGARTNLRFTKL